MLTKIALFLLWIAFAVFFIIVIGFGWGFNILLALWVLLGFLVRQARQVWAVLKEEVLRPLRVIRKALSRKREIALDEYEQHLS